MARHRPTKIDSATTSIIRQPQAIASRWSEVLLIVMVFFVLAGEIPPHVNEAHYLSRLKHYWNSDWCQGDLFLDSPEAHVVFVWTLGWLTKWLSLPATAWVGRLLVWTMLAWAWQRLSWRIVPVPLAAVLSAALWATLTLDANLAGEWVVGGVEAKCFAYVFVLLALRELADLRWNRVWLALGAASAFHAVVGGWSVIVCGGIWLAETLRGTESRHHVFKSLVNMLPGLLGGGLIALAGVLPALALTWNRPPDLVAEANRIYVFERLPHHLSPLTLPAAETATRMVRHGLLIVALCVLCRAGRRLIGPMEPGLRVITWYAWGAVLVAAVGFVIEIALWGYPNAAAALLKYYWFRLTDIAVSLAVALHAVRIISAGLVAGRTWAAWALAACLVMVGSNIAAITLHRAAVPVPPADQRMRDYNAWVDACEWIAANTPPDALFITPRRSHSFKWRTGRPEVATWKDLPQDAPSMVEWFDRLRTLYYWEVDGELVPAYSVGHLGTERVLAAARRNGADYVLTDNRRPLDLPIVYPTGENANEEYVLYRVPK